LLGDQLECILKVHRRRYDCHRLGKVLSDHGVTCAPARIRRLMAQRGLRDLQPKNFLPKTSDSRANLPSHNLLDGALPLGLPTKSGPVPSLTFPPPTSRSARANPYHNATTESFFGTLKREKLLGGCFHNAADAKTVIFEFIKGYYNTHRKHSSLNYQTPSQFEPTLVPKN
jgi:transposase InsO family protein